MGRWAKWHVQPWPYIQMAHALHDHNVMSRDQGKVPNAMPSVKIALKVAHERKYTKQVKSKS